MKPFQRVMRYRRTHGQAPRQLSRRERAEMRQQVPVHLRVR
ncbi:hypothetical protein [Janibacter endophyticus]|jgi:hypothetical protein|nr:hypothetical protein [Janibacter endophyticus]